MKPAVTSASPAFLVHPSIRVKFKLKRACRQFFGTTDAKAIFEACWKPVLAMVSGEIEGQLQSYNDVIGLLIMTRIVGHCQLLMIHAQAPILDGFLDRIGLTLWPHYSKLIRAHIEIVTPGTLHSLSCILVYILSKNHSLSVCVYFLMLLAPEDILTVYGDGRLHGFR